MKIVSIRPVKLEDIPRPTANTKANQNAMQILEALKKTPHIQIDATDTKKFERYQLQKRLQSHGAKVVVTFGHDEETKKPCYFIRTLSEKEWKDYQNK